jgi:drug/metabolite transporter (DMT)-like permease
MNKSIVLGILSSFFFAFTFVLNRQMDIAGGSWIWSASLRYFFMFFILLVYMILKKQLINVITSIKKSPISWFVWSTVGFGLFYAPLCFASSYGASWLVAGTWQITIIAGALLSPMFFKKLEKKSRIPKKSIMNSTIILVGIFIMQFQEAKNISFLNAFIITVTVLIAAFSYPLGNRKMMEICDNKLTTLERIFGMTLCSLPFWIVLSLMGLPYIGPPSSNQIAQSLIVAIFSGIIATTLFFKATELVKTNPLKLSIVESTQAGEILFTLLMGVIIFKDNLPSFLGFIGLSLIIIGMILNSFCS